jgi:hypothetical protein
MQSLDTHLLKRTFSHNNLKPVPVFRVHFQRSSVATVFTDKRHLANTFENYFTCLLYLDPVRPAAGTSDINSIHKNKKKKMFMADWPDGHSVPYILLQGRILFLYQVSRIPGNKGIFPQFCPVLCILEEQVLHRFRQIDRDPLQ